MDICLLQGTPKLTGIKFATKCDTGIIAYSSMSNETFADGSAAAKRLKHKVSYVTARLTFIIMNSLSSQKEQLMHGDASTIHTKLACLG